MTKTWRRAIAPLPRRRFVEVLLGGGFLATVAAFVYPVLRYLVPPKASDLGSDSVVAGRVGELKPNSGKIFRFGNHPGLLIRTASGEYRAMSAICTHLSCTVQYRDDLQSSLVRLPQRSLRPERPKYRRTTATPAGRLRGAGAR